MEEKKYKPEFFEYYEYFENGKKIFYEDLLSIVDEEITGKEELRIKIFADADIFYKWQLLRRNPVYKRAVEKARNFYGEKYVTLSSGEANEIWKISEYCDFIEVKPSQGFYFNIEKKLNFYQVGDYSFKDFCIDEESFYSKDEEEEYPFDNQMLLSRKSEIYDSSILGSIKNKLMVDSRTVPNLKSEDKRFCFIVVDLKNSSSIDDLTDLTSHLQVKIKEYGAIESNKQFAPKKMKPTKSIEKFDKGILVYDYVTKNQTTDGAEKEITNITGKKQYLATLKETYETFNDYVQNVDLVFVQLNKS